MSGIARILVLLAATTGLATGADARRHGAAEQSVMTLDRAHPAVQATIAGVATTLGVGLGDGLDLSPDLAGRLPVTWQPGPSEYIGRVVVRHRQASGDVAIVGAGAGAAAPLPMTLRTQDLPCCNGQPGTIGAIELPASIIRIGAGDPGGERRYRASSDMASGYHIEWKVGRQTIHVVLSPDAPETVATAAAAAILSKAYGGRLGNDARAVPIVYGVTRTVREMTLAQPASLLGFPLSHIAVRIVDYAGDSRLPEPDQPPQGTKQAGDEIVVRHRPLPPQFRWAAITVGRDLLDRCPQISVYRDSGEIGLVCR